MFNIKYFYKCLKYFNKLTARDFGIGKRQSRENKNDRYLIPKSQLTTIKYVQCINVHHRRFGCFSFGWRGGYPSPNVSLTTPLRGRFVADSLGHAKISLPTKFEMPIFNRYGNIKCVAKCRKLGGLGWLVVTQGH